MFKRLNFRLRGLVSWLVVFAFIPALAQFEVAPDHFDSSTKHVAHHATTKKGNAATQTAARRTKKAGASNAGRSQSAARSTKTKTTVAVAAR